MHATILRLLPHEPGKSLIGDSGIETRSVYWAQQAAALLAMIDTSRSPAGDGRRGGVLEFHRSQYTPMSTENSSAPSQRFANEMGNPYLAC